MAIIKLKDGAEIRGKLGGSVYSRNRYGNYVRGKTQNVNPRTVKQVELRNRFSQISSSWRALTAAQQLGWNEAAMLFPRKNKVGDTIFLTGSALFSSFNTKLSQVGIARNIIAPIPANFSLVGVTVVSVDWDGSDMTIQTTGTLNALFVLIIEATPPYSTGVQFTGRSKYRYLTKVTTITANTISITAPYNNTFGQPSSAVEQNIFISVQAVVVATGEYLEISKKQVTFSL